MDATQFYMDDSNQQVAVPDQPIETEQRIASIVAITHEVSEEVIKEQLAAELDAVPTITGLDRIEDGEGSTLSFDVMFAVAGEGPTAVLMRAFALRDAVESCSVIHGAAELVEVEGYENISPAQLKALQEKLFSSIDSRQKQDHERKQLERIGAEQ